ncbi:MAG: hypothetical protein JNJ57_03275 [Saprospiraceae bacterium]|nr:hypothetical protein [Saprospiraceae bacterium]
MGASNNSSSNNPEALHSECLSSNSTLFYRVFVPIFGTVFLCGFLLAFLLIPADDLYMSFSIWWARGGALAALLAWLYFVKSTVWRLKRADATEEHLFVTNYWHTVRYPWSDIENVTKSRRMGRDLVHFHLKAAGRFGQTISILPVRHFDELMKNLNVREI